MKNDNQLYRWSVTYFGPLDDQPKVAKCFDTIAKDYIYQLEECPTTKSTHYQCFIKLKKKLRKNELHKVLNGMSLRGATVSPSADDCSLTTYCMKKESRLNGPWSNKPIYLGHDLITQLRPWQKHILDMKDKKPHSRKILWYYDAAGGVGKTSLSKYLYFHHNIVSLTIGKASDLLNLVFKRPGLPMYIFDISRTVPNGSMNEIYQALESVKNGYFVNTKYDTGIACYAIPHLIVFSNHLPRMASLSLDRWDIYDLSQMSQEN